jgi:protein-tyrosine-phosphatase/DNA-binding HxlR family transcriptional regulator
MTSDRLTERARLHAALGDPGRLAIVDDLRVSDRSPSELVERLGVSSNLLAHHLDVLESVGAIERTRSAGDARRRYVRLGSKALGVLDDVTTPLPREVLFVCTRNSARSQLAAALWRDRTGCRARSAGTRPAASVNDGARAAARRAGVSLDDAAPTPLGVVTKGVQVITVCDLVHEELDPVKDWWHWSIPAPSGRVAAFDAVVAELIERISRFGRPHGSTAMERKPSS